MQPDDRQEIPAFQCREDVNTAAAGFHQVVGEPAIEYAEWLEACATNEPSQSDAEKLWTCAQLIRTLASRISQQDAELERLQALYDREKAAHRISVAEAIAEARKAAFIEAAEIADGHASMSGTTIAGKIRAEIGWAPRVTFAEGLERTARWFDGHPALRDRYEAAWP